MAKAANQLPIQSHSLNRRALLRGGSLAAASVAVAGTVSTPTSALPTAQPTELGRAFLAAVKQFRAAFASGELPDEIANAATDQLHAVIEPLTKRINSMPVTSISHIVDRAIVIGSRLSGSYDIAAEDMLPLVRAVCVLAGLDPEDHMV
jgi:hypothetical protein